MTKEELVEFLKENLRIETQTCYPYYDSHNVMDVDIKIFLGDEEISTSCFSVREG